MEKSAEENIEHAIQVEHDETEVLLAGLLKNILDCSSELRHAATNVADAALSTHLRKQAEMRLEDASSLRNAMNRHDMTPPLQGDWPLGALWEKWVDIQTFMQAHDTEKILEIARNSQQRLIDELEQNFQYGAIPPWAFTILDIQRKRIYKAIRQLHKMSK